MPMLLHLRRWVAPDVALPNLPAALTFREVGLLNGVGDGTTAGDRIPQYAFLRFARGGNPRACGEAGEAFRTADGLPRVGRGVAPAAPEGQHLRSARDHVGSGPGSRRLA